MEFRFGSEHLGFTVVGLDFAIDIRSYVTLVTSEHLNSGSIYEMGSYAKCGVLI